MKVFLAMAALAGAVYFLVEAQGIGGISGGGTSGSVFGGFVRSSSSVGGGIGSAAGGIMN